MDTRNMMSFPECILCKTPFKVTGPNPFLFPCLHAFCERCMKNSAKSMICPRCPKHRDNPETKLKEDKVRKMFVLHLTAKNDPSKLLCSHDDDGNHAVSWCQDCEELFCEYCYNLHCGFKALKGHVFKTLEELAKGGSTELREVSEKARDVMKVVQDLKEACGKEICRTEGHFSALQTSGDLQKEHISQTFGMLRSLLDQREKETNIRFASKQQDSLMMLRRQTRTCKKIETFCNGILEYNQMASTVCFADDDMVFNDLMTMTQFFSSYTSKISAREKPSIEFVTQNLPGLREAISEFSKITCSEDERTCKILTIQEMGQTRVLDVQTLKPPFGFLIPKDAVTAPFGFSVPKDAVTAPSGFSVPKDAVTAPSGFSVPKDAVTAPSGFSLPKHAITAPSGFSLPKHAVTAPSDFSLPKHAITAPSRFSIPIPAVTAPSGFSVPKDAITAPSGFSVPKDAVTAPSGFSVPKDAVTAPSGFSVPKDAVTAPSGFSLPKHAVTAPSGFSLPKHAITVPSRFSLPIPEVTAPSGFSVPMSAVTAPSGFSIPTPSPKSETGFSVSTSAAKSQADFSIPKPAPAAIGVANMNVKAKALHV